MAREHDTIAYPRRSAGDGPAGRPTLSTRLGRRLLTPLWSLAGWLRSLRKARAAPDQARRIDHRSQTRTIGIRFTERLRDRLRSAWLRLHR